MEIPYNDRPQAVVQSVAQVEVQSVAQAGTHADVRGSGGGAEKLPQPEISIIVDGNKIIKPGMKSVFIDDDEEVVVSGGVDGRIGVGYCSCNSVSICTCNTVCTCEGVCVCNTVCSSYSPTTVCSCNSQSGRVIGCSCAPVH